MTYSSCRFERLISSEKLDFCVLSIIFKIRYWKSLQNLLGSLINSIEAIISLLVLLFLFLGIFALLGTQVFGGKFRERKVSGRGFSKPRANFDTFSESFYAVFQVRG